MAADQDRIHVSLPGLQHVAGELESILSELDEELEALYGRTAAVVRAWKGEARSACVDELDEWDALVQDMRATQRWLHQVAVSGHANYAAAHAAVLRGWGAA
ncbi:WXG100 family type VII secretion target [Streptomyces montanisoli]|uniref:WXG100 family type VII secretion target n=1 Tax=Streptomyces montanisoli TaxID=2798581 RepID=A0A940MMJ5_9ACTN|nr:WXG100 family type VII secretion target [Streptomyces montanisoli]MBP0461148.1 WXG100 family type VII secretion target [Streptomyces montanisoli]